MRRRRRPDDAADRKGRAQVLATLLEVPAEQGRREGGVHEPGGDEVDADRSELEREVGRERGQSRGEQRRDAMPTAGRLPPVPPMNSSVPPGRTLPPACRATWSFIRTSSAT